MDSSNFRSKAGGFRSLGTEAGRHFQATVPGFHAHVMDSARDSTFSDESRESLPRQSTSIWRGKSNETKGAVHGLVDRCTPRITEDHTFSVLPHSAPVQGSGGRLRRQTERIKDYMSSILRPARAKLQRQTSRRETPCLEVLHPQIEGSPRSMLFHPAWPNSPGRNPSPASSGYSNFTDPTPPSLSRTVDTCETASSFPDVGDNTSSQGIPQHQSDAIEFRLSLVYDNASATERFSKVLLPLAGEDIPKSEIAHDAGTNGGNTLQYHKVLAEAKPLIPQPQSSEVSRTDTDLETRSDPLSTSEKVSFSEASSSSTKRPEEERIPVVEACGPFETSETTAPPTSQESLLESNRNDLSEPPQSEAASSLDYHESSDSTFESGSSSDESGSVFMERPKQILVERLMQYFYLAVSPSLPSPPIDRIPDDFSQSNWRPTSRRTSDDTTSSKASSFRKLDSKRLPDELDDEPSGGGDGQKRARLETFEYGETARLACPYFKKIPQRYCNSKWRSCPGPGWNTVHRVKEHIYRCHALPITCPRCHEQFDDISLRDSHLVANERCEIKSKPQLDGFDSTQEKLLRKRNKGTKHLTEADKWRDVYLILFPDTGPADIPSPYLDFGGNATTGEAESAFDRYERYLRRELPKRVRQELEIRIDQALEPLEENLKSQIVDIVRDAQLALFQSFVSEPTNSTMRIEQGHDGNCATVVAGNASSSTDTRLVFDGQLEALRPPPYLEEELVDFNGLLFDLSDGQAFQEQQAADGFFETIKFGGNSGSVQQNAAMDYRAFSLNDSDSAYVSMSLSSGSRFEVDGMDKQ